jgi:hypothetical protein
MSDRKTEQVFKTGRGERQRGKAEGAVEGTDRSEVHKSHAEGEERRKK